MDLELCYLPAHEALSRFRDRSLSPVELTVAVIARAEAVSDSVNPFADRYFDEALAAARRAEARYARPGARTRRLEGIPLAVKDSFTIRGRRSTVGSLFNANAVGERTDPCVERLLRAGAVLFARTTCPEFCWLFACHSRMWGVTRNPWRADVTPGGSSGGSAAALAAGAATLALGSDSTGSIRQPAAQCGIVGYQGPYGRFPIAGRASFDPYVNAGPMTRTIRDAALMTNVMAGPHPLDHNSLPRKLTIASDRHDIAGLRIACSFDLGHYEIVDDVRRETAAAMQALHDAGAVVEEVEIGWASDAIRLAHLHEEFLFVDLIESALAEHPELVCDYTPELAETARSATADDFRAAIRTAGIVWRDHFGPLMQRFDAFVCPTVASPEVPAENWQQHRLNVNARELTDTDLAMTALFNMFDRCPVLAIPSGMTGDGLPTGLQIVGRPYDDPTVFRIGRALEIGRPWLDVPGRRPPAATRGLSDPQAPDRQERH
ncbi:MAG: amidase [Gammaproteobacteria bacterium]